MREPGPPRRLLLAVASWIAPVCAVVLAATVLVPTLLGYERYVVVGHSMEPTIPLGSIVYSSRRPVTALSVGDVVTFVPPVGTQARREQVTHRIVWTGQDERGRRVFRTKGDNPANAVDPWTVRIDTATLPVQRTHVPYVGWVFIWLAVPWVRLLVLVVPAVAIAVTLLVGQWRDAGRQLAAEADDDDAAHRIDVEGAADPAHDTPGTPE